MMEDIFLLKNEAKEIIKITYNGDIYINSKLIENDKEVVDALRDFLSGEGFLKKTNNECGMFVSSDTSLNCDHCGKHVSEHI